MNKKHTYPAERIKLLRKELNITQKELASSINFSESTVKQYEAGNRVPDRDNLQALARFFKVTESYLLGESEFRTIFEELDNKIGEEGLKELRFQVELRRRFEKSFGVVLAAIPEVELEIIDKEIRDYINYKLNIYKEDKK